MKEGSIGPPKIYLGGTCLKQNVNGIDCLAFSSSQYVQGACENVRKYLSELNKDVQPNDQTYFLPKKANAPFKNDYRPEIDVSDELSPEFAAYYQSLIGILRWMVELGRVDITAEVSMMSSCLALPREGHLKALFHMFRYLELKHNVMQVFDPNEPEIDLNDFPRLDRSHTVYADGRGISLRKFLRACPKHLEKNLS